MKGNVPEFGIKREGEERRDGGCAVIFDPSSQKYAVTKSKDGKLRLASGGVDEGEDIETGVLREVTEETGLDDFLHVEKITEAMTHYRNSLKGVNRCAFAVCFLVVLKSIHTVEQKLEEHEQFELHFADYEEILSSWKSRNEEKGLDHWIYFMQKSARRAIELGYDKNTKLK